MESTENPLRVLELYSGIGGMRFAMELANIPHKVVAAMDINPVVNSVYCHNFGSYRHYQRNIESLSVEEIDQMEIDILTMSPPCQPFTRVGLKKDINDARTDSFMHVLKILAELQHKPKYILLENVLGFEDSVAHSALLEALEINEYRFQEFLLSPLHFGIPNSRLRFYLIAKLKPERFSFTPSKTILAEMPICQTCWKYKCHKCFQEESVMDGCLIQHFLEDRPTEYFDTFLVPDKILLKYSKVFDIVCSESSHSCCFTKAYGRYALGTGSVFSPSSSSQVKNVFENIGTISDNTMKLESLKQLRLRYFTPREVANLMCFPRSYRIPISVTTKQQYQILGNSVNVYVVSCLMKLLLGDH